MDIRAKSSATFRVAFRPPLDGQYFCQTLEVVACFKAHRSFRGVAEGAVLPPWTIPVQVRHTLSQIPSHSPPAHTAPTLANMTGVVLPAWASLGSVVCLRCIQWDGVAQPPADVMPAVFYSEAAPFAGHYTEIPYHRHCRALELAKLNTGCKSVHC